MRTAFYVPFVSAVATMFAIGQTDAPVLTIVSPTESTLVSGRTLLAAEVAPVTTAVRQVTFFVDGAQVCQVAVRPFECDWNAGSQAGARTVRAVADLRDGARLVQTFRTTARRVLSASTDAILVPVHVTDGHDHVVRGLDVAKFRVSEDGIPQEISALLVEETPISLLLALDVSGSMTPALPELRAAADGMLRALRPQDRVTIAAFNDGLSLVSAAAVSPAQAQQALGRLRPSTGATALYDGIVHGVDLIKTQPSPRAIVVFTDGDDNASHASADGARTSLQSNDVLLYVIAQGKAAEDKALRDRLSRLASETGGTAWFAAKMNAVKDHFSDVVTDLSGQYVLAYSPKRPLGDGAWRRIAVDVPGQAGVVIRARTGYLATTRTK